MKTAPVYLDNAATTKPCEAAVKAAVEMMRDCYGNPSSLHALGVQAARALAVAREQTALLLGCQPESIYFTSGGSEANNLAIFGAVQAKIRRGRKVVTTAAEHPSVSATMRRLEETGWTVEYIVPDADGNLDPAQIAQAVDGETVLVSMMQVNNETGAIFPVERAAQLVREKNPQTLIHCDAVQAFGKLPLRAARTEIDLMSVSGHKIGAPKGVGALYVRRGVRILPLIYGGGQERGLRAGTESLPLIAAFGATCSEAMPLLGERWKRISQINAQLREKLEQMQGICINSPSNASPYILNFSVLGYRSEILLHFLEQHGIYVSSGSACSKGASSTVLAAMGLSPERVDSALRISFGYEITGQEPALLCEALVRAQSELLRAK